MKISYYIASLTIFALAASCKENTTGTYTQSLLDSTVNIQIDSIIRKQQHLQDSIANNKAMAIVDSIKAAEAISNKTTRPTTISNKTVDTTKLIAPTMIEAPQVAN